MAMVTSGQRGVVAARPSRHEQYRGGYCRSDQEYRALHRITSARSAPPSSARIDRVSRRERDYSHIMPCAEERCDARRSAAMGLVGRGGGPGHLVLRPQRHWRGDASSIPIDVARRVSDVAGVWGLPGDRLSIDGEAQQDRRRDPHRMRVCVGAARGGARRRLMR